MTLASDPQRALLVAQGWAYAPYPAFRRLGFFAATHESAVPVSIALQWLLSDGGWWMWSVETERETMRLIVSLAPRVSADDLTRIVDVVLAGPPRSMFRDNIENDHWRRLVDRETWLRLAKIAGTGVQLPASGAARLTMLVQQYPEWSLASDERDEFPFWMESAWVGNRDPWREFVSIPRSRQGTINYLHDHPEVEQGKQDDWRDRCSTTFQATALALCSLAREGTWPENRWREALQAWSDEKHQSRSWRFMGQLLSTAPDPVLQSLTHAVSYWMHSISKQVGAQDEPLFVLAERFLDLDYPVSQDDDVVTRAINHPIGHVTEALLRWWYVHPLEDDQGLPARLKSVFTRLCDVNSAKLASGRVLLAAHVIALFRVDPAWAEANVLPLFDWQRSLDEARAAWEGFLWSPRLYRPLMEKLKSPFLEAAAHYDTLGKHGGQYAALLTFAALDPNDVFTPNELANATRVLPVDGLHECARALVRSVESAGEQRADFWSNRVAPYLRRIWPNTRDHVSPTLAESLGRLCVAAHDHFPEAIGLLRGWLSPPEHPDYVVHVLASSGLCTMFPSEALGFLDLMIADNVQWLPRELRACLDEVAAADAGLRNDVRYQRLLAVVRQHGQ